MLKQIEILVAQRIKSQVESAVAQYKASHANASDSEIAEFEKTVAASISTSAAKTKLMNSKSLRKARKDAANAIFKSNNFVLVDLYIEQSCKSCSQPASPLAEGLQGLVREFFSNATIISPRGMYHAQPVAQKVKAAVRYDYAAEGSIELLSVFTFLNPIDVNDDLIGLENLAERIQANQVMRLPVHSANTIVYGFSDRLEEMALQYREEFLMDTSKFTGSKAEGQADEKSAA